MLEKHVIHRNKVFGGCSTEIFRLDSCIRVFVEILAMFCRIYIYCMCIDIVELPAP